MRIAEHMNGRRLSSALMAASLLSFFLVPLTLARATGGPPPPDEVPPILIDWADCVDIHAYLCPHFCTGRGLYVVVICDAVDYESSCENTNNIRDCGKHEETEESCGGYTGCNT